MPVEHNDISVCAISACPPGYYKTTETTRTFDLGNGDVTLDVCAPNDQDDICNNGDPYINTIILADDSEKYIYYCPCSADPRFNPRVVVQVIAG